jgi:hypothetical protein
LNCSIHQGEKELNYIYQEADAALQIIMQAAAIVLCCYTSTLAHAPSGYNVVTSKLHALYLFSPT